MVCSSDRCRDVHYGAGNRDAAHALPVSAQTSSCAAPVISLPRRLATVSAAPSAYGRVLVVGSGENSGCSLYLLTSDQLRTLTPGGAPFRRHRCHYQSSFDFL